jgi:hypothetical protein
VTFYNKMLKTIAATSKFEVIEDDISSLKLQLNTIKERQLEGLDANIRLQEKAADAYVLSKEASAISKSTQRELEASTANMKSEVDTALKAVNEKLDVIKRATTNPLGR